MKTYLHLVSGLIFGLLLCLSGEITAQNYSLKINNPDGTAKEISLNELKKITFQDSGMNLMYVNASNELFSLTAIQSMIFTTSTSVVSAIEPLLTVYPNPAISYISLKNLLTTNEPALIYSATGTLLKNVDASLASRRIDVSDLSRGIYFVRVNNQTLKFIKL